MGRLRVGVDIGGTFTDIVFVGEDGSRFSRKISSTTENYARAIVDGLVDVISGCGLSGAEIVEILHGTTVASNVILEQKGARTALITTKGFRDVLEIRTLRMPRLYDMSWTKPPPLVERRLRYEVDERVNAEGEIDRALDEQQVEEVVRKLLDQRVEAVAVCLLHSYANPAHEQAIKRVIAHMAPEITLCISSEVLPEIKEYERTSTTTINAYVQPTVRKYLLRLIEELTGIGVRAPLLVMQSNGGLTTPRAAAALPVNIIESGPAAGVIGVQALVREIGISNAISFDMGGTTAKASLIENGEVMRVSEYSVGGDILIGSRLLSGAGYTLKAPAIDLAEVGAGGGSILWIDSGGALQIGPQSAGALPGPVCYGLGGLEPTLTDANVVLGYINPHHLVGGALKLDAEKSQAALQQKIAAPLGMSIEEAAFGAHRIAASNMIRAIKAVSSERGRDPRDFALVAFGGNGPLFAATMADTLSIERLLIPPFAGVFSSIGLLSADVEYHFSRSCRALLTRFEPAELRRTVETLEKNAVATVTEDGFAADCIAFSRYASLHYKGQSSELEVPMAIGWLDSATLKKLAEDYGAEHERTYGHRAGVGEPVELVKLKVVARVTPGRRCAPQVASGRTYETTAISGSERLAYFGPPHGWLTTQVVNRPALSRPHPGPCIVEEYDCTAIVPPGWRASLDSCYNIAMAR
jgi:N-methylhydantoinase A